MSGVRDDHDVRGVRGVRDGRDVGTDLDQLRTSARGWHGVQLAVLGFIGLCGALTEASGATGPRWLQLLAGALVILALVVACAATVLVAGEAWPLRAARGTAEAQARHASSRLRVGVGLTFVAVAMTALATSSSWWPAGEGESALVTVSTGQGSVCGTLLDSSDGTLLVEVSGRRIAVPLGQVLGLAPAGSCPG